MKERGTSLSLGMEMFALLNVKQMKLVLVLVEVMKELNVVRPFLWSRRLNRLESKNMGLQEQVLELETCVDNPVRLLPDTRRAEVESDMRRLTEASVEFLRHLGESSERRKRIYTLLEHLERRTAEKRNTVNFNRTLLVSFAAIAVAVASIVVGQMGGSA